MRQEILSGVERRRRWSVEEKLRVVSQAAIEGRFLADVARQNDITRSQIYQWRNELRRKGLLGDTRAVFAPVELSAPDNNNGLGGPAHDRLKFLYAYELL
jgi:transposase